MFYFFLHTVCFSYMSSYSSLMGKFFWTYSALLFTINKMVFFLCHWWKVFAFSSMPDYLHMPRKCLKTSNIFTVMLFIHISLKHNTRCTIYIANKIHCNDFSKLKFLKINTRYLFNMFFLKTEFILTQSVY